MPEKPDFPQEEEQVLQYWREIDAFKKQLAMSEGKKEYTFYDGPPFATGLPHYGHIAAGTIKVSSRVSLIREYRMWSRDTPLRLDTIASVGSAGIVMVYPSNTRSISSTTSNHHRSVKR